MGQPMKVGFTCVSSGPISHVSQWLFNNTPIERFLHVSRIKSLFWFFFFFFLPLYPVFKAIYQTQAH
ncbi:hypothetical protein DM01DRAFT_1134613 [Hesseltinella vesiculosa]|uniref:Uncharacterized protein n=1 Tax=Hesseltinella vesiculosa TaxID=101127 RepID=A0A1X2G8U6_9FUNG|nr:hypothetical protein DM01DRAFT_1134613 [Hesseltinella vesiculosa]